MSAQAAPKALPVEKSKRRSRDAARPILPRYDQALLNAKNEGKDVAFVLDTDTDFTDDDCKVTAGIVIVDKFDVAIQLQSFGRPRVVWVKKSHIVTTEVL